MDYVINEFLKYLSDELKLNINSVYKLWDNFNNNCVNQIDKNDKQLKYFDYQSNLDSIEETIELTTISSLPSTPLSPPLLRAPPPSPPPLRTQASTKNSKKYLHTYTPYKHYEPPIRTSYDVSSRKSRARHEPIYIMKFVYNSKKNMWNLDVHGMTKNYTINVSSNHVSCNCIDFNMRAKQKNILCKHLYNFIYQLFNNTENVSTIEEFNIVYPTIHEELYKRLENYRQRTQIHPPTNSSITVKPDDSCLICLVDLEQDDKEISFCKGACKQILGHNTCLKIWFMKHNTCPLCRSVTIMNNSNNRDGPLYEII